MKYDKNNPVPGVPGIKFSGNASITVGASGTSIKPKEKSSGQRNPRELIERGDVVREL